LISGVHTDDSAAGKLKILTGLRPAAAEQVPHPRSNKRQDLKCSWCAGFGMTGRSMPSCYA